VLGMGLERFIFYKWKMTPTIGLKGYSHSSIYSLCFFLQLFSFRLKLDKS